MDPVICGSCGARFPVTGVTEEEYGALHDQHYYQEFAEEWRMLLKVQDYYRRHPGIEGRIKSRFARLLGSDDPSVKAQLYSGVPCDQIELPPEHLPEASVETAEDAMVVEYLRHRDFMLGPRLNFVSEGIERYKGSAGAVACPLCRAGRLHVPPEEWDNFTVRYAITCYWPDWHGIDGDGTLHVKTTGWQGGSHWTGETTIESGKSDYDFWRWLVGQKEYHRLVEESELASIREEWLRRTTD